MPFGLGIRTGFETFNVSRDGNTSGVRFLQIKFHQISPEDNIQIAMIYIVAHLARFYLMFANRKKKHPVMLKLCWQRV